MKKEFVSVNGELFTPEDAKISVFDRGFLYGDGVYEVTRSYRRVLFALEDHVDRLFRSAERINLDMGYTKKALIDEIYRLYTLVDCDDMYMRVVVTRGQGRINLDPYSSTKPNIVVFFRDLDVIDPELYKTGMRIITSSVLRNPKKSLDPNIKSGNYLNNILALGEAKRKKALDAIMINKDGYVTEGTTWNIFMVKDKTYITAPDESDILHGITRQHLRQICKDHHLKWQERYFTPDELKDADEAFASSSLKEVMPVHAIDEKVVGHGKPGEMTLKLAALYKEVVNKYCSKHQR